ncbi:MAG: ornithine carbamoyltransferase [Clostridia bacterium]|nr:ornithine carbamoyltransferase [Clostridia bacterium]MBT7123149.1 ornithine carbamoyltransferase [Clostridia bacterium]
MLKLSDYTPDEIMQVLSLALNLKTQKEKGYPAPLLGGKILAMIFTKSSTRTRVSFEAGIYQLGGTAQFLSSNDIQLGRGEPISDTAKVLSRMVDGIMIRTFAQSDVEGLAEHGSIPVINGLTDLLHPCQILADLLTYYENVGSFDGKMAYIGDGNNVANSLLIGCAQVGLDVTIACPKGFEPDADILATAQKIAANTGATITITQDPKEAVSGATAVYTDVWASMGQESDAKQKHAHFTDYQVNSELMALADKDAIFLHCLPAHRGEEVTSDVIDGDQSVVFDEAENRLHAQKAVMVLLMKD